MTNPGWKNESERHSLASKGVPTKQKMYSPSKILDNYEKLVDKYNGVFFEDYSSPENGLLVEDDGTGYVKIVEWTDISGLFDNYDKDYPILRIETTVNIKELMRPDATHRGSYSGDVTNKLTKESIIASSLSYMAYWGGNETFVSKVGD